MEVNIAAEIGKDVSFSLRFEGAIELESSGGSQGSGDTVEPAITKTVTIDGKTGLNWVNTGIDVRARDIVRITAKGKVDVGAGWGSHGPEGTDKFAPQPPGYYPVESKMRYGLAARITSSGGAEQQKWAFGDEREKRVAKGGRLWLTVNDDAPDDNTGEFVATVTIIRPNK